MIDMGWLTTEAQRLNWYFTSIFYSVVTTLLVVGVLLEYFKLPLGHLPSTAVLVGRSLIAFILLGAFGEISDALTTVTDSVASGIGGFANIDLVMQQIGQRIDTYKGDWLNTRALVTTVISLIMFAFLFVSVLIAEIGHLFTWTLLYVFSPLLIALFVLPATAGATSALFRSMIEVCFWKIVWAAMASLLWAGVLFEFRSNHVIDEIKVIGVILVLSGSLVSTPFVVTLAP